MPEDRAVDESANGTVSAENQVTFPSKCQWRNSHTDPPQKGQEVYYFGPQLGIHIGRFDPTVETKCWVENEAGEAVLEEMPPRVVAAINHNKFINNDWGVCDADDAPWWMPYDPERAKSWVPLPPPGYMRQIVDMLDATNRDE